MEPIARKIADGILNQDWLEYGYMDLVSNIQKCLEGEMQKDIQWPAWKTGAKVFFIGGGPEMTVLDCDGRGATCGWFDKKDSFNKCYFLNEHLEELSEGVGAEAQ
jgi:uncharacterized protein YodC (DUF2158 family)